MEKDGGEAKRDCLFVCAFAEVVNLGLRVMSDVGGRRADVVVLVFEVALVFEEGKRWPPWSRGHWRSNGLG